MSGGRWACVQLGDRQVSVVLDAVGEPVACFDLAVKENGVERRLTRDEELAWCAARGTAKEREAAIARVKMPDGGDMVMHARRWHAGDKQSVKAQLAKGADIEE